MLGLLFVPDSPFSFGSSEDEEATLILFPDGAPWGVCEALFHHFPRPLRRGPTHAFPATTAIAAFHLFLHWLHSPPTIGLLSESESDSVLALRQVNTSLFSSGPASSVTSSQTPHASASFLLRGTPRTSPVVGALGQLPGQTSRLSLAGI